MFTFGVFGLVGIIVDDTCAVGVRFVRVPDFVVDVVGNRQVRATASLVMLNSSCKIPLGLIVIYHVE